MLQLPTWCETRIGRELISSIIAAPPERRTISHRLPSVFGGYPDGTTVSFTGKAAGLLRRLRQEWVQRELWALDQAFAITKIWDSTASERVLGCEDVDALIERVLAEAADQRAAA